MTEAKKPRLTWSGLAIYCLALFAIWTLREFLVRQQMVAWLGVWGGAFAGAATKLLIWTLPALLLVRRYREDMAIPYLFREPVRWGNTALWAAGFVVYNLAGSLMLNGRIGLHPSFEPVSLIGTVLFVGITEEVVFRGFLLNALLKKLPATPALLASAALFTLIHFPIWITKGIFDSLLDVVRSCITVFALGTIFGMSFLRERNLLPAILLHMLWNLLVLLLIGG